MAIFCDYENVALGAKDAKYPEFDISLVLERLLDKGNVVVKKAYCDWERYKAARRPLHEAAFELIEIPHVSYSGKNSADIRLVVDALDLCYTKSHIGLFVVVSGDSDFSPLVSKLRENDKLVIGVGVKNSSSDLLIENCDDFIFYDDLVRAKSKSGGARGRRQVAAVKERTARPPQRDSGDSAAHEAADDETKDEALELVLDTVDGLFRERDDTVWGSMVKQTLKRKRPGFNEAHHGYRSFSELLDDARQRGFLELQKDEKSGGYLIVGFGPKA